MPDSANSRKAETRPLGVMFHCHLLPKALQGAPGTLAHLMSLADALGFGKAGVVSPFEVPEGRCNSRIGENEDGIAWLEERACGAANVIKFASLVPERPDSVERLEGALAAGFAGVKLHPNICRFAIDARRDAAFYSVANSLAVPVLLHTGVMPGPARWPMKLCGPERIDELAGAFPDMPLILAHGGGRPYCREMLAVIQGNPNTYLDLTHTLDQRYAWHIPADDLAAFFAQAGPSRIIYGTDYPWFSREDFERDMGVLRGLGLSEDDVEMLLGANVERILARRVAPQ